MWETTHKRSSCLYATSSIGSRCLPGLVVLRFSPMVNTYLSGNACMRETSSFVKVWHHCPVRRKSNIVSFLVRVLRLRTFAPKSSHVQIFLKL